MTWEIIVDDCRAALRAMLDASVDSVVTDPPYELGFMGRKWDKTGIAYDVGMWSEVLRVLKPGGHVLAFGGTRTYHRMVCAIEDAGFEIRDSLQWLYGTGFPKSFDVSKAIDAHFGNTRPDRTTTNNGCAVYRRTVRPDNPGTPVAAAAAAVGLGTALKPAVEPICLARKPLDGTVVANVLAHGTGALNINGCRISFADEDDKAATAAAASIRQANMNEIGTFIRSNDTSAKYVASMDAGRWPANVLLDEEAARMLDAASGVTSTGAPRADRGTGGIWSASSGVPCGPQYGDTGGASRFFYVAKPDRAERDAGCDALPLSTPGEIAGCADDAPGLNSPRAGAGRGGGARNIHPTVKPIDLGRYLARLITPRGGRVLDPFLGSGSLMIGAMLDGFDVVGIEQDTAHACIAWHRLDHWNGKTLAPESRTRVVVNDARQVDLMELLDNR